MNGAPANLLDVLRLTPLQRKLVVHLTREGPANAATLAQQLTLNLVDVEKTLVSLAQQGRIQLAPGGQAEVILGQTRQRTLPARLWPALTASSRLYTAQEIVTLRTVVPILQFARAKLSEFVEHGPPHTFRVKAFATQLGYVVGLSAAEQHLLRAGALFHDVGNIVERARHHIISQETVEKLTAAGELPFSAREAELVGLLCRWHRKEYDPTRVDELLNAPIRTGMLASILRVADAMDIDQRRSDYATRFRQILAFFYPQEILYWTTLDEILGVRICCTPAVRIQVFTQGTIGENLQIEMLHKDLASTPFDWSVEQRAAMATPLPVASSNTFVNRNGTDRQTQRALVAFPFEPNSLLMAALSRQQLQAAGYVVELLCYPDTREGAAWLWQTALAAYDPRQYGQLVVLNDRTDPTLMPTLLATTRTWQTAGATVNLFNRHENQWGRVPSLLQQGVHVILGGDWAYFWGDSVSQHDLAWARLAALCMRDPTQAVVRLPAEEEVVLQGLLQQVYATAAAATGANTDWRALAEPLIDRIGANDRAFFMAQAQAFGASFGAAPQPTGVDGGVLIFTEATLGVWPPAYGWALEAAIEQRGRLPERGICFKTPYAIATWPDGDAVELLAINHWREENAIPIRLLYPADLGPAPQGNESAIQVRLSPAQAAQVVAALVEACNRSD
ncbi:MAG: HD domain-containing protein [Caldilineaceae bacterium]